MSGTKRGGIPGPESRTGLVRPSMTEAEFERRIAAAESNTDSRSDEAPIEPETQQASNGSGSNTQSNTPSASTKSNGSTKSRGRGRGAKLKRVQRMFAIEEEVDKKLWLYAIHVGKDRSEVVNDLLRPLVGSMVLYDSSERKSNRNNEHDSDN